MSNLTFSENVSQVAQRDILELQAKIGVFSAGEGTEEAFRKYRLARGVYGQRQPGVQMIRIKLPYGRITADQLVRIADCSDKYATGNLHATTRQDIQLHFVKLADSPQLWAELEDAGITLREACGNTVRNVTASFRAGVDPDEPFDVTPYAHSIFEYFLRNPICQEMGRKFKIAVSSSEKDTAFGFMHDVGLIPKWGQNASGETVRGFKVLIGGGLGAQPFLAQTAHEFLEQQQVIPFIEALIRVFDRYGERTRRHKARMKFLLNDLGLEGLLEKVEEERLALKNKEFNVETTAFDVEVPARESLSTEAIVALAQSTLSEAEVPAFTQWLTTNVFEQKQKGWYGVQLRVLLGDFHSSVARQLADLVRQYAADDLRVTVNQGYLLRFVKTEDLPALYLKLKELGLADPGFDSTADITTCPGTDTCNLAITSSYGITRVLEKMMQEEFPDTIYNNDIKIKISGCMNGCGQHSASNIGFHGSSIKNGKLVLPALQVLLGGGFTGDGAGQIGDKVIKIPAKRGPESIRLLLRDYEANAYEGEYFNQYYARQTKNYFYQLLKPLADLSALTDDDYRDWDHDELYKTEIGVGECAGVLIDLVGTTLIEAEEKLLLATENFQSGVWADAIYHAYNVFITSAKALLIGESINTNTQHGIVKDFDEHFGASFYPTGTEEQNGFRTLVFSINKNEPTEAFASQFIASAQDFLARVKTFRETQLADSGAPQLQELVHGQDS
ncbi:nitrite/sulfite reductase [Rhabdobacter roseus]|uniref:Sulfite reductase (Ferredoxin) n=1 Tax=Rhabdobacter roseus TaxID=1655419 RepID=A0A840TNK8_9BACT|nr:HEPN domain-containing protein [Rhabdobacter roseus]MBB5285856.1 sulfite reductase (ferredoxin) [Rhabdobacter roseus]